MAHVNILAIVVQLLKAAAMTSALYCLSDRIPSQLKLVVMFVLVLNIKSIPFNWHIGVFQPVFYPFIKSRLYRIFGARQSELKYLDELITFLGKSPFDVVEVWTQEAALSDSDYNLHLSNSSYAKYLDHVRMRFSMHYFVGLFNAGGTLALGGSYFTFLKEIPAHAQYEIRMHISGWDEEWIYIAAAYVSYPTTSKSGPKSTSLKAAGVGGGDTLTQRGESLLNAVDKRLSVERTTSSTENSLSFPPVSTLIDSASVQVSGAATPLQLPNTNAVNIAGSSALTSSLPPIPIPDGALLHAVSVSQYCFKHGRVTVPPHVALTLCGFGKGTAARWDEITALRTQPTKLKELIRGGWKEDTAGLFAGLGDVEVEGRRRGEELCKLRTVMGALAGR